LSCCVYPERRRRVEAGREGDSSNKRGFEKEGHDLALPPRPPQVKADLKKYFSPRSQREIYPRIASYFSLF
jgi:hypothetical protein